MPRDPGHSRQGGAPHASDPAYRPLLRHAAAAATTPPLTLSVAVRTVTTPHISHPATEEQP